MRGYYEIDKRFHKLSEKLHKTKEESKVILDLLSTRVGGAGAETPSWDLPFSHPFAHLMTTHLPSCSLPPHPHLPRTPSCIMAPQFTGRSEVLIIALITAEFLSNIYFHVWWPQ